MIKRIVYAISTLLVVVLNFITFLPLFFFVLIWTCIIEPIVWVVRGRTVLREPFDMVAITMWGSHILYQLERKLNLDLE